MPPEVTTPPAPASQPTLAASPATSRCSRWVATGAWSQESSDWLVAAARASAATAAASGWQWRWAAQAGWPGSTPWRRLRRPSPARAASSPAPSSGNGSTPATTLASAPGLAPL